MEIISKSKNECSVLLNNLDVKAINSAVKLYQDRHKDHTDDNVYQRLQDIEDKLHELFVEMNPK